MKTFHDINNYYGIINPSLKRHFEDFKIMRFEELQISRDQKDLKLIKTPHLRDFFELSIGLKEQSNTSITIGENKFTCVDNNLIFASPSQVFSTEINKQEKQFMDRGYVIAFKPSVFIYERRNFEILNEFPFFNSHTLPQYIIDTEQLRAIHDIFPKIYSEYIENKDYSREVLVGQLNILLYNIKRILNINSETFINSSFQKIAIEFEKEIISDKEKITTINKYASRLNISPNYLSECVKKASNKSAMEVLLSHKLIIAKTLLKQTSKNINEIAEEMNFSETTNFIKFFKKMTGITPSKFRK